MFFWWSYQTLDPISRPFSSFHRHIFLPCSLTFSFFFTFAGLFAYPRHRRAHLHHSGVILFPGARCRARNLEPSLWLCFYRQVGFFQPGNYFHPAVSLSLRQPRSQPVSPLLSLAALRFPRSVADFPQSNTVLCPLKILLQRLSKRRIIEFVQRQANNSLERETVPVPLFFLGFFECRCSSTRVCRPWTRVFQLLRDDIQRRRELAGICRGWKSGKCWRILTIGRSAAFLFYLRFN